MSGPPTPQPGPASHGGAFSLEEPKIVRSAEEIQHAHDLLTGCLENWREAFDGDIAVGINSACDVLCWILGHEDEIFGANIAKLEKTLAEIGVRFTRACE